MRVRVFKKKMKVRVAFQFQYLYKKEKSSSKLPTSHKENIDWFSNEICICTFMHDKLHVSIRLLEDEVYIR